jgi:hypothetical protein
VASDSAQDIIVGNLGSSTITIFAAGAVSADGNVAPNVVAVQDRASPPNPDTGIIALGYGQFACENGSDLYVTSLSFAAEFRYLVSNLFANSFAPGPVFTSGLALPKGVAHDTNPSH